MHYDNDNEPCRMRVGANGTIQPPIPELEGVEGQNYYGCLGKNSIERPGNTVEDTSGLYSDCFDCTAALMAVGRIIRRSNGRMPRINAELMVAEDMVRVLPPDFAVSYLLPVAVPIAFASRRAVCKRHGRTRRSHGVRPS